MKGCWMVFMPWLLLNLIALTRYFSSAFDDSSSKWEIIEGIESSPKGKSIVNSISLKEERTFIQAN
jgi:cobalamin-dependent methionine synthase I